jgi:cell division protein ZapA (FtsZ GTPase activity inhibitor)
MSSTAGRVELTVLGQRLTVRSAESPEYLTELARFVEDRAVVLQRGGVRDPMSALALAAIEIADELHRARDAQARDAKDVGARIGALVSLLDSVTPRER